MNRILNYLNCVIVDRHPANIPIVTATIKIKLKLIVHFRWPVGNSDGNANKLNAEVDTT